MQLFLSGSSRVEALLKEHSTDTWLAAVQVPRRPTRESPVVHAIRSPILDFAGTTVAHRDVPGRAGKDGSDKGIRRSTINQ